MKTEKYILTEDELQFKCEEFAKESIQILINILEGKLLLENPILYRAGIADAVETIKKTFI